MGPGRIRNPRPPTRSSPVEVIRTWEDGGPASGLPFFVVIPVIHLHRHDILMCSHVHRGGSVHMGAHQHISTETQEPCHDRENSHPLCLDPALPCAVPFLRACAPLTAPAQCNACNKSRGAGPSCAAPTAPRPQAGRRSEPVFLSVPAAPRSRARWDKTRRTSSPRPPDGAGPRPAARPEGASFAALAAGR